MTQSGSSSSTCGRPLRQCSRSEGYNIHLLAMITEEHADQSEVCNNQALAHRSKSESVIRTTQGVKFEDKCRKYQTRLDNLMALAADPCSSKSNALIAQKALRYRNKTMERRRASS
ncbi:hypothetical protein PC129_g5006 [Phytophthora cactorum]|uniref:Uncharacterized protein n=1 Tax=Phytophthora cactorum TaxID=29920 RepID=A0A329SDY2_9STRA|nr:hypothetical protein Pcac1_g9508 [Phytophthora cactorum]KAG2831921.1 hypothetical protein PC112_g7092 [Phytophthora cactorum]KAG2839685.1 hypothetical protein PC111_g3766 [Phytophthora cactorum]KAG2864143.1 hypothetical protein PC113_g4835 [Phytophthora cactorum]KAG2922385.1 hypothetical protein PC114_g5256 [Phytophthora cactorum]